MITEYALLLSVWVGGVDFLAQAGEPMSRTECIAKAEQKLAEGFELAICRPLKAEKVKTLVMPSGMIYRVRVAGVDSYSLESVRGGLVFPEELPPADFALFIKTLEEMQKVGDILHQNPLTASGGLIE